MIEILPDDPRIHNCMMTGYMYPEYEDPYLTERHSHFYEDDREEDEYELA